MLIIILIIQLNVNADFDFRLLMIICFLKQNKYQQEYKQGISFVRFLTWKFVGVFVLILVSFKDRFPNGWKISESSKTITKKMTKTHVGTVL